MRFFPLFFRCPSAFSSHKNSEKSSWSWKMLLRSLRLLGSPCQQTRIWMVISDNGSIGFCKIIIRSTFSKYASEFWLIIQLKAEISETNWSECFLTLKRLRCWALRSARLSKGLQSAWDGAFEEHSQDLASDPVRAQQSKLQTADMVALLNVRSFIWVIKDNAIEVYCFVSKQNQSLTQKTRCFLGIFSCKQVVERSEWLMIRFESDVWKPHWLQKCPEQSVQTEMWKWGENRRVFMLETLKMSGHKVEPHSQMYVSPRNVGWTTEKRELLFQDLFWSQVDAHEPNRPKPIASERVQKVSWYLKNLLVYLESPQVLICNQWRFLRNIHLCCSRLTLLQGPDGNILGYTDGKSVRVSNLIWIKTYAPDPNWGRKILYADFSRDEPWPKAAWFHRRDLMKKLSSK